MVTPASVVGVVVLVASGALLLWLATRSAILKDQLVPQIAPAQQTFSLARTQMAFWFVIILACYLYLFVLTKSSDLVSGQALTLMGISVLTAGGAAVVEAVQDTPEDALNDGLRALGLSNYQDVLDLQVLIAALQAQGPALSVAGQAALTDKLLLLQIYRNRTRPFQTQGWFKDMATDIDGTALHRLQALIWTGVLGAVFIYEVYVSQKVMPDLDPNLLALMGISNAGYVGFKYNETQY